MIAADEARQGVGVGEEALYGPQEQGLLGGDHLPCVIAGRVLDQSLGGQGDVYILGDDLQGAYSGEVMGKKTCIRLDHWLNAEHPVDQPILNRHVGL